jgi:hypothetical protein
VFKIILFTFLFFENLSFYENINKYLVERGYAKRINKEILVTIYQESQNLIFEDTEIEKFIFVLSLIELESSFYICAKSYKGAMGLMQIIPYTADWLIKKYSLKTNRSLCDPKINLKLGVLYLNYLWLVFKNKEKVIMAYNLGHNAVLKGKKASGYYSKFFLIENRIRFSMKMYTLNFSYNQMQKEIKTKNIIYNKE